MRERGWYWVKDIQENDWEPRYWNGYIWLINYHAYDPDPFDVIGPKIEEPN